MSPLVLHLLANEGGQFIGNQKGLAIAGGLVLVEKSKMPKFQDGTLVKSKMGPIQNKTFGKSSMLYCTLMSLKVFIFAKY